jgi:hypothetical protein
VQVAGQQIADRAAALSKCLLTTLTREHKLHVFDHGRDRTAGGHAVGDQRAGEVVWLRQQHHAAVPQDTTHLGDDHRRIGNVDEQRLASHKVKGCIVEWQRLGGPLAVLTAIYGLSVGHRGPNADGGPVGRCAPDVAPRQQSRQLAWLDHAAALFSSGVGLSASVGRPCLT